jgi:hypothetical protein
VLSGTAIRFERIPDTTSTKPSPGGREHLIERFHIASAISKSLRVDLSRPPHVRSKRDTNFQVLENKREVNRHDARRLSYQSELSSKLCFRSGLQKLAERLETSLTKQVAQLHVIASTQIDVVALLDGSNKVSYLTVRNR